MRPLVSKQEVAEGLRLAASQPESAAELQALLDGLRERLTLALREEDQVRSRLAGHRSRVVGVDYREDKVGGRVKRLAEVGFYDYDSDVLLVAVVDPVAGKLLALEERENLQPPITAEEREEAIRIAGRHGSSPKPESISAGGTAFITPSYRLSDERSSHRCCTLYIGGEHARGGVTEIVVDLSAGHLIPKAELLPPATGSGRATGGQN